jgi:hypothetical protein
MPSKAEAYSNYYIMYKYYKELHTPEDGQCAGAYSNYYIMYKYYKELYTLQDGQ